VSADHKPLPRLGYFLRPIPTSPITKSTLSDESGAGLYPAFSASGQDVWSENFDYDGEAIIVSAVGAQCGKTFLAQGKWAAIANTVGLKISCNNNLRYFWYLTNTHQFWEKGGAAQPYVKIPDTLRKRLKIPDLETQKAIADFLDRETARLDVVKSKTNASIDRLREYRAALITAAVTGQIDVAAWGQGKAAEACLEAAAQKEAAA
jgi:type I restriction enzyme, S subunit